MKNNKKLVLKKDTVKNLKIKTDLKAGAKTRTCSDENSSVQTVVETHVSC
jgi:hypothetical protein